MILVLNIMIDGDDDPGVAQDAVLDQEGGGQRDLGLHGLHRGAGGCLEENWRCGYFVFDHLLSSNSLNNSAKLYLSISLLRKRYVALNEAEEHSFQELFSLTFTNLLSIRGHSTGISSFQIHWWQCYKGTPNNWLESAFATQFWLYQLFTKRAHAQMQWRKSKKKTVLYCTLYSGFKNGNDEPF